MQLSDTSRCLSGFMAIQKDQIVSCFQGYVRSDVKFFVVLSSVLTLLVSYY